MRPYFNEKSRDMSSLPEAALDLVAGFRLYSSVGSVGSATWKLCYSDVTEHYGWATPIAGRRGTHYVKSYVKRAVV